MSTDPDSPLTPSRLPDVGKVSQFAETKHREIHVRMRARKLSLTKNSAQVLGERLLKAATDGDRDEVESLLLQGANVNYTNEKGYSSLIRACRMQRVEVVRQLLKYNPDVNLASKNRWTALIEACRVGHAGLAEELIAKGADIDCTNVMGWTPMIEACRNRHLHVVKLLISKGSKVEHLDKDNMAALDHTSRALTDIRDFLKKSWREKFPVQWEREQQLRAEGKWPEAKETLPGDAMGDAALKGDNKILEELVRNGVSVDSTTSNGAYTPLIFACRSQQLGTVRFLLEKGANVNKQSTAGWTPCIEASRVGNLDILKLLVESGGDINVTNAFGWHGLIEACRNVNYDVVEWSIEHGCKVDHYDLDGECAMDHTTHPWIRGLLQGGPRNVLRRVFKAQAKSSPLERRSAVLRCINELVAAARKQAGGGASMSVEDTQRALFEVVVQELRPELIAAVLDLEGFTEAVLTSEVNIVRAIVLLDSPSEDAWQTRKNTRMARRNAPKQDRETLLAAAVHADEEPWDAVVVINSIFLRLFPDAPEDQSAFINLVDRTSGRSTALECAMKYAKAVEDLSKKPVQASAEGLSVAAHYYYDLLEFLFKSGASVNVLDGGGSSVLHYLMQGIPLLKECPAAMDDVFHYVRRFIELYGDSCKAETLNSAVGQGEKTPLCYLVHANPHLERERLLMTLLEKGQLFPEPAFDPTSKILEYEQARVLALVGQAIKDPFQGPSNSWAIMVCAVSNGDYKLVHRIIASKFPVYLTNPDMLSCDAKGGHSPDASTDEEESNVDALVDAAIKEDTDESFKKWTLAGKEKVVKSRVMGWARVDMSQVEECLLHIGIEQEDKEEANKKIFLELLDYADQDQKYFTLEREVGDQRSFVKVGYPWPTGKGENMPLTWQNSFGQNSFHVCANKKQFIPSATNSAYFKALLDRDIHSVVTRQDAAGWSPMHYASYHNKPEVVEMMIAKKIDLENVTNTNVQHRPLHLAAMKGNFQITIALLAAEVGVDQTDWQGCTPLALAMLARQNLIHAQEAEHGKLTDDDEDEDDDQDGEDEKAISEELDSLEAKEHYGEELGTPQLLRVGSVGSTERDLTRESLERERETYNFTIEALLGKGASIQAASEASGKDLTKLMDVDERWMDVCNRLNKIEVLEERALRDYQQKLPQIKHDAQERRAAKDLMERRLKVLEKLRPSVFEEKESQVVIDQYYHNYVRKNRFSKLARFCVFLFIIIGLGLLETTRNNHTAFYLQKSMVDSLATNEVEGASFENINLNRADWYGFAKGALLQTMYPTHTDSFWAPHNTTLPRGVVNHYNTPLGRPRLRQIRSKVTLCDVPGAFRYIGGAGVCFTDFNHESTDAFGPQLREGEANSRKYHWASADKLQTPSKRGKLGYYAGSGYVMLLPNLGRSDARASAEQVLAEMEEDNWVDAATRAVFLEFTLYNPHENHFLVCTMLTEFPLSGGAVNSWNFDVVPLRRYMSSEYLSILITFELLGCVFAVQHVFAEWVQFQNSDWWNYWSSFYNWLDVAIAALAPAILGIQLLSVFNAGYINWEDQDSYINVERQVFYANTQTSLYSIMIFLACLKMFDYLSVFRGLYRLIVMIEMMSKQLSDFVVLLALFLGTFTVSEYVAYGYRDENSYSIGRGFIARVFGLFSGDPVTFGHSDSGSMLGSFYVMIFLISVSMVLMNLIVAMLTSAYDEARNQSSDVLAQRQYDKMNRMGLTKKRIVVYRTAEGRYIKVSTTNAEKYLTSLDVFDHWAYVQVAGLWESFQNWLDAHQSEPVDVNKTSHKVHESVVVDEKELKTLSSRYGATVMMNAPKAKHVAAL